MCATVLELALVAQPPKVHPVNLYVFVVKFLASSYVCVLFSIVPVTFDVAVDGLFALYTTVYVFAVQFAVYVLLPVVPLAILTVVCAVVPFEPVQPAKV